MTGNMKQAGLTLIELLVALAISATVMSGVVSVLFVSKSNFISERELAVLQENARYAIRFLSDEIHMAGFNGCGRKPDLFANALDNDDADKGWYLDGPGLEGYDQSTPGDYPSAISEAGDLWLDSNGAVAADAIVVRRSVQSGLIVDVHHPNSSTIDLAPGVTHSLQQGEILVVSSPDCVQAGIFQISNNNPSNANDVVVHNKGASTSPGNCTPGLTGNFTCDGDPPNDPPTQSEITSADKYAEGSPIMLLRSHAMYIGSSGADDSIPALYREAMRWDNGTSELVTEPEELVQGVENMQILYGLDTDATPDGFANRYVVASAVADWQAVVSVRLMLRMRSINPVYTSDQTYSQLSGETAPIVPDRFMRQVVSTTIQLRN